MSALQLFTKVKYIGNDKKDDNLNTGEIGFIIEIYDNYKYEVEFSNQDGSTKTLLALNSNEIVNCD